MTPHERNTLMCLANKKANETDTAEAARLARTIDMHLDALNRSTVNEETPS